MSYMHIISLHMIYIPLATSYYLESTYAVAKMKQTLKETRSTWQQNQRKTNTKTHPFPPRLSSVSLMSRGLPLRDARTTHTMANTIHRANMRTLPTLAVTTISRTSSSPSSAPPVFVLVFRWFSGVGVRENHRVFFIEIHSHTRRLSGRTCRNLVWPNMS